MDYLSSSSSDHIELYEDLQIFDRDGTNNEPPKWYNIFNHYYKILGIVSIFYIIHHVLSCRLKNLSFIFHISDNIF